MKTRTALVVLLVILSCWSISRAQLNCSGGPLTCGPGPLSFFNGSNLEQAVVSWASNILTVGVNTNGGTQRQLRLNGDSANPTNIAVSFGLNGTDYWAMNGGLHFYPIDSNARDIGLTTTNTVRSIYAGTSVVVGITSTATLTTANFNFRGNSVLKDGTPTCSGNGCALVAGSINSSGALTTTTTGAVDITVTFSSAFDHAPNCVANNETTANLLRATSELVGSFHIQGTTVAGDTLDWICIGN